MDCSKPAVNFVIKTKTIKLKQFSRKKSSCISFLKKQQQQQQPDLPIPSQKALSLCRPDGLLANIKNGYIALKLERITIIQVSRKVESAPGE